MQDYSHLNQFGSLIDDCERVERGEAIVQGVPPVEARAAYGRLKQGLLRAQRFIGPELGWSFLGEDTLYQDKHLELVRLPFDEVAVLYEQEAETEAGDRYSMSVVTLYQRAMSPESAVAAITAVRYPSPSGHNNPNRWMLWPTGVALDPDDSPLQGLAALPFDVFSFSRQHLRPNANDDHVTSRVGSVLVDLCCALACSNVVAREVGVSEKTASRRAQAGKKPLYSYKVLEIDGDSDTEADGGQSHRPSPRTHLRRGHIRRLPSGRIVWVNAAIVKGKTPGIVVKDYRVGH